MSRHVLATPDDLVRHCPTCLALYRSEFTRCPVDGAHVVTSHSDPMLGVTVAEHYQIDELIGIGSSGRVYLAHHRRLAQRRFALKILFGDLAATASARMRFTHEAESASRLAHPNLVSVVDFGKTSAGLLYLAMDFIEGPTLASLIDRDGAMAQERAVRMGIQLCRGLAHAHDLGLIHRDFKPDNILVSNDAHGDVPRIVDFGIALSADDGDPRLTATGVTLGTPAYAAPEQTTDGDVDHRADLFALGVTMYEMLTGVLPFQGTMVEIMRQNATADPPPMNDRAPGAQVTSALQHVVFKLMARDPNQRYQTAREALEALTELPRRVSAPPSRASSMVIPSSLPISSSTADRAGARTTAMAARQGTPPSMTAPSSTGAGAAIPTRTDAEARAP
ncbi:MAG TPA: serine/threonine-protein kinase, partial [Kofleriaceae bacterium]|nr:serine/threonine-protein kinase [Kofleriaceae bacterium]